MKTMPAGLCYFLYARKSSEAEDQQVASIDAQIDALQELARREGLEVLEVLSEAKSAKSPGRPVFERMLERIGDGEAHGILCWKLNRLARNPIDGGQISWMLQQGAIQHIRTHDRSYYPTDNVLMMAVEFGMANQYIRDLSADVRRGLRAKCEAGWMPSRAPLGYLNSTNTGKGRETIFKDPERFPLVRKIFDHVLAGHAPLRVLEMATDQWGLRARRGGKLSRSYIYTLLGTPFYCGVFEHPKGSGNWYRGRHEPMLTEEEFDRVQAMLGTRGRPRPKRHQFAFTGLIRCGECGAMVTAEEKVKRQQNGNVHRYVYYHCTKRKRPCSQKTLEEKSLTAQILEILASIALPTTFQSWALKWLQAQDEQALRDRKAIMRAQQEAYNACVEKIDALIDLRTGREINEEEFSRRKAALTREKLRLAEVLTKGQAEDGWLVKAKQRFSFPETASEGFVAGSREQRRQILLDLGSNLTLRDRRLDVALQNELVPIRRLAKAVRAFHATLEPAERPVYQEDFGRLYAQSPLLCGLLDDVRTSLLNSTRKTNT